MSLDPTILLIIALAPLLGAIVAGLFGKQIGRAGAHWVTILGVAVSCVLSFYVLYQMVWEGAETFNQDVYTWFQVGSLQTHVGFMIDRLSAMMMVVVTFVSLMVHIYTIGYMAEDDGYQRFFAVAQRALKLKVSCRLITRRQIQDFPTVGGCGLTLQNLSGAMGI